MNPLPAPSWPYADNAEPVGWFDPVTPCDPVDLAVVASPELAWLSDYRTRLAACLLAPMGVGTVANRFMPDPRWSDALYLAVILLGAMVGVLLFCRRRA